MSLAVVLVDDTLHGGVVVHPGHAHVIAHDQVDLPLRYFQSLGKDRLGLRVEPHENRDSIDRFPPQGGMNALLGVHNTKPPHARVDGRCLATLASIFVLRHGRRQICEYSAGFSNRFVMPHKIRLSAYSGMALSFNQPGEVPKRFQAASCSSLLSKPSM